MTIVFRPTQPKDIKYIIQAEQSSENKQYVDQWSADQHLASLNDHDILHMIIEKTSDRTSVGYMIVAGIETPNKSIEFRRIVITEKGKGYGRKALRMIKKMAFEEYKAHRLWLDVRAFNQAAQSLYKTEGFKIEGVLRECLKVGDRYESVVIMSMLVSEYFGT